MTAYGVQPTGYVRKPLVTILAELEAAMVTQFGAEVIQTAQSPLGQLNGLMAELIAKHYEFNEEIYQAYDPDQSEGVRLDTLGRIRLLVRATGESDEDFRRAVTNAGRARVDLQDLARAIAGLDGVTYSQVFTDDENVPVGHVAVAIQGGSDDEIAATLRQYIVPGVSTFGNYQINSEIEGYCRTMTIVRPIEVPVTLQIFVRTFLDRLGCAPPSATAIKNALLEDLAPVNGQDIDWYTLRQLIEKRFSNVEVTGFIGERDNIEQLLNQPVAIGFIEIATIAADAVTITVA